MWFDIFLQAALLLAGIIGFLWMHNIPHKAYANLKQWQNRHKHEAKRHFVRGAQMISQARRPGPTGVVDDRSLSLARSTEAEADAAIKLDPTDAAAHVLKALALELQGFNSSALDSISAALAPIAVKSLTDEERGDALYKKADLRVRIGRSSGESGVIGDAAVEIDLVESVKLKSDSVRAWCLLGECYEAKEKVEKAKEAYESAVKVAPDYKPAVQALERLAS